MSSCTVATHNTSSDKAIVGLQPTQALTVTLSNAITKFR